MHDKIFYKTTDNLKVNQQNHSRTMSIDKQMPVLYDGSTPQKQSGYSNMIDQNQPNFEHIKSRCNLNLEQTFDQIKQNSGSHHKIDTNNLFKTYSTNFPKYKTSKETKIRSIFSPQRSIEN